MNELFYVIDDELPLHNEKLVEIEKEIIEQWKEKKIAFSQWETFHDNPAWEQVEMEQKMSSWKLSKIKKIINNSRILTFDILKNSPEKLVSIWKKVIVKMDNEEKEVVIWGYETPIEWRISYNCPLAKSIIWKEEWDESELNINWRIILVEILSVSRAW